MINRPFATLIIAQTISVAGTRLAMMAIPWLVLTTTNDTLLTGVVVFAQMVPYVIAKALGGPWIDRRGARNVSIIFDLAAMLAVVLIPVLHFAGLLSIITLLPIVVLIGTLLGPADASKQALVPAIADAAGLPLERVTGVIGTIERLSGTAGAAAGGLLIAAIGAAPALIATAVAILASAVVVMIGLPRSISAPATDDKAWYMAYASELAEGWSFFKNDAVLVGIVVMVALTNMIDVAYSNVLVPVWVQQAGASPALLGAIFGTFSAFAILGAAVATGLAERLPRLVVYTIAFLLAGAPRFFVFIAPVSTEIVFVVVALAGFAAGFINPIISAVTLERIPRPLVGRVSSLIAAMSWMLMPFGGLLAGALVSGLGLSIALAAFGSAYFLATMLPLKVRSFRAFAERPTPPQRSN